MALNRSQWKRSAWVYGVTGLGVIYGATAYQPPLSPYRAINGLHSVSCRFKMGLGWLVNAYSGHSIMGRGRVERGDRSSPWIFMRTSKRIGTQDANGRFYNCIGWDRGGGHVGRWSSLSLVLNCVVWVLGNEGGVIIICKVIDMALGSTWGSEWFWLRIFIKF